MGAGFLLEWWKCSEISDDGLTTLWLYSKPWNYIYFNIVNFMVYKLYDDKK